MLFLFQVAGSVVIIIFISYVRFCNLNIVFWVLDSWADFAMFFDVLGTVTVWGMPMPVPID